MTTMSVTTKNKSDQLRKSKTFQQITYTAPQYMHRVVTRLKKYCRLCNKEAHVPQSCTMYDTKTSITVPHITKITRSTENNNEIITSASTQLQTISGEAFNQTVALMKAEVNAINPSTRKMQ
uniref:Reverse transcriptase domain-containing protein n=1 Tax=Heterorhabditis bacteriophora TaxID=37862 RepID=A0A1I7WCB3_HETBA